MMKRQLDAARPGQLARLVQTNGRGVEGRDLTAKTGKEDGVAAFALGDAQRPCARGHKPDIVAQKGRRFGPEQVFLRAEAFIPHGSSSLMPER